MRKTQDDTTCEDCGGDTRTPGQVAYDAYCEAQGWKSYAGTPLPKWGPDLRADIRAAWEVAATAAVLAMLDTHANAADDAHTAAKSDHADAAREAKAADEGTRE